MFGPSKSELQAQIDVLYREKAARVQENDELRAKLANMQTWINLTLGLQGKELHHIPAQPPRMLPAEPERWEIRDVEQSQSRDAGGRFKSK